MAHQNYDIRRVLPAEFQNGGYGNYEAVQSLSSAAAAAVDPNLLQHENPNRCTEEVLSPRIALEQYRLNVDQNPHVIRRKPNEKVQYCQEIAVRYLKPPPPPKNGDIIIRELPNKQVAPAPPLIVRQPGPKAPTPPPVCIRECPPQPPQPLPGKTITIQGKVVPPPARKVIVERLPPVPPKPQQVFVERWLPYGAQTQRVIYERTKPICHIPDPKNVVIQWEAPDVEVRREVKNLGVQQADPQDYVRRHQGKLIPTANLPEVAVKYAQAPQGAELAANARQQQDLQLEGDVQALNLIDLEANGLGYLRGRFSQSTSNLASASYGAQQFEQANSQAQFADDQQLANNAYSGAGAGGAVTAAAAPGAYSQGGGGGGGSAVFNNNGGGSAVFSASYGGQGALGSASFANGGGAGAGGSYASGAYHSDNFTGNSSPDYSAGDAGHYAHSASGHHQAASGHFEASHSASHATASFHGGDEQQSSFTGGEFPC